jgi:hypothetical protein
MVMKWYNLCYIGYISRFLNRSSHNVLQILIYPTQAASCQDHISEPPNSIYQDELYPKFQGQNISSKFVIHN